MNKSISILELPFFSTLVKDYIKKDEKTNNLYSHSPSIDGLKSSLQSKKQNYLHRDLLKLILEKNYNNIHDLTEIEKENIKILKNDGFAVTTAHQPNLFGGPLYTITKAASTISLSNELNLDLKDKKIIPIYILGSEDHDQEELLNVTLFGKNYFWQTDQKGAIGTMIIDDSFLELLKIWTDSFGNMEFAEDLKTIYYSAFLKGQTIAFSQKQLLRALFKDKGLIILDLNLQEVKEMMIPIFELELKEKFSFQAIEENLNFLKKNYSIQASPREINLFEFINGERIRIDKPDLDTINRLKLQPKDFSPNVILRPIMQQIAIPSIANIGGGAEVAYWLQLKPLFIKLNLEYPVIILRDIICPIDRKLYELWEEKIGDVNMFFKDLDNFRKEIALQDSDLEVQFIKIQNSLTDKFTDLKSLIMTIDKSLIGTYESENSKLTKSLELILSKLIKAEKKKSEDAILKLEKIKIKIVDNNNLIERKENFSSSYLKYGPVFIDQLVLNSNPLKAEWKLLVL